MALACVRRIWLLSLSVVLWFAPVVTRAQVDGSVSLEGSVSGVSEVRGAISLDMPADKPCISRPGEGPQMVLVESGRYTMGSPDGDDDELPQRAVAVVQPFALARCETTVGEFSDFVDATGYLTDAERGEGCFTLNADGSELEQRKDASWRSPGFPQGFRPGDGHPVVCVSFNDANAYARWLSLRTGVQYRLPTEAEWEYAARGGTTASRFWGDDPDAACDYANGADRSVKARFPDWTVAGCDDGALFTAPAGNYRRNPFGLSDMLGNAWEWVQDCWHDSYDGAPDDGSAWLEAGGGDCARRVLRGGGWDDGPRDLRSAYRFRSSADAADLYVGIRLARTL